MLLLFHEFKAIDISQLMVVWKQSNREKGQERYPWLNAYYQQLSAEEDCCESLRVSMREENTMCAVWAPGGQYRAAVRLEKFEDGILLAGLETAQEDRRKGYAEALLRVVLNRFTDVPIYSHIDRNNLASIRLHEKCGFSRLSDHARYLDGSVSSRAYTYLYI